jgi:hypothetical protein
MRIFPLKVYAVTWNLLKPEKDLMKSQIFYLRGADRFCDILKVFYEKSFFLLPKLSQINHHTNSYDETWQMWPFLFVCMPGNHLQRHSESIDSKVMISTGFEMLLKDNPAPQKYLHTARR